VRALSAVSCRCGQWRLGLFRVNGGWNTMVEQPAHDERGDRNVELGERAAVQRLLRLAGTARLFRAGDGRMFARVPIENRSETYGLKSGAFRDWLIGGHFRECGELPSESAIRRVIGAVEAFARFGGGGPSVFIRVGGDGRNEGSVYYIDLGDSSGRAIEIGAGGWCVVERPGVGFRRPGGLLPIPEPSREGSIDLLRPYVNLTDRDFRLLVVWMAAALRPAGPYPLLALYGEQGSAKSTLARVIRLLIDPQEASLLAEPGSVRDLMVTAVNGWLLAFDNVSVIRPWLSDGLCRLATGGGYAGRALFSDDERVVLHAQRPVVLNGIDEFVRRGDLSDRTVFLNLPPIPSDRRRREEEFWDQFRQDQPRILGGLLDAIAGGLRELPSLNLEKLPRMADFAAFAEAVGRAVGWKANAALLAYGENRRDAAAAQVEDSVLATFLMEHPPVAKYWQGTATELLRQLSARAGKSVTSTAGWPKSPAKLTSELRRIIPQLRRNGLTVEFTREASRRLIVLSPVC
jgi:hypothetical protein